MTKPNLQQQQLIQQKVTAFQQYYINTFSSENGLIKASFNGKLEITELKISGKMVNEELEIQLKETINRGLKESGSILQTSVQMIAQEVMSGV
jgi:DNA-binding protein YbaB